MNEEANEVEVEEAKQARNIIDAVREIESNDLVTLIGYSRGAKTVFEIVWKVPADDDESQKRYNCSLESLIKSGVRALATRPNYQTVGFDSNGVLLEDGQEKMQDLADAYKVGQRATSEASKEKRELDKLLKEKGLSLADLISKAKDL